MDLPIPQFKPMLAASGPIAGDASEWAFEPKFDGWRATVTIAPGRLLVSTRNGRDVTDAVPDLQGLVHAVGRSAVLDGELVAHSGKPSTFYRLGPRMAARRPLARSRTTPVAFVAFDVLWLDGSDLTRLTYCDRRGALESLRFSGPSWCTGSSYPGDGAEVFAACVELGLEGVMAKRLDGRYYPGQRKNVWIKAKTLEWRERHASYRHQR